MLRRLLPPTLLALALTACADRADQVDADLARDLQLATQTQAEPQLQDVPLETAPEQRPARPNAATQTTRARTSPAPERRTAVASAPRVPAPRPVETPRPVVEEPAPVVEQAAAPRARGIAAGTSFGLTTKGAVCTSNLPGDKIVATTTSAVIGENGAVIPAGTSVVLEVASVTPGDDATGAQIALRVLSIVLHGEPVSADASVAIESGLERGEATANNSDKKKVIGGAIAGAVIGQILGRDTRSTVVGAAAGAAAGTAAAAATRKYHACLPAGAAVRVTTTQPIVLD